MPKTKLLPDADAAPLGISGRARRDFRKLLAQWFAEAGRDLPWRRTHDPYAIFVSEMMLQQTQVVTVIPYFQRWLERFPTVQVLAAADEPEVLAHWQGLGYYARARNLHRAARQVVEQYGGTMPGEVEALRELPGAGRYTAGAIASFAYDQAVTAVDANIGRVLARLFEVQAPIDTPAGREALWAAAELLLPPASEGGRRHNSALMELGALVCVPRRPRCAECPVRRYCAAREPELLPRKSPRRKTVEMEEDCEWIEENGRIVLERQVGTRWAGLWKLPKAGKSGARALLWEAVYPFTHHRVTLRVYAGEPRALQETEGWFESTALAGVAMAAPHRRAVVGIFAAVPRE